MANETEVDGNDMTVQEHCIDLPGESVRCWIGGGTDKLKVVLRKHRDVIFDINLGNGKTYSLEATESDFYNPREKRLVYASRNNPIQFKDGERLHVWISRGFRGSLVVKCGEHVISSVKPNEWDPRNYSNDPKEKPAPIIVAIGNAPPLRKPAPAAELAQHARPAEPDQSLHIREVTQTGAPPRVLKFFQDGGQSLDLDNNDVVTQNWIIGQLTGGAAYITDNRAWIKELAGCKFYLQNVMHKSGPKTYIIFSGNNKIRQLITASRYGLHNTKVITMTGGAAGAKQTWDAATGAAKGTLKVFAKEEGKFVPKATGVAFYFTIAMGVAEWYKDYSEIGTDGKPKKDLYDLAARLGIDILKAGLAAALATAAVAVFFSVFALTGATLAAPMIAVVVGTIAVGGVLSYFIDAGERTVGQALSEPDTSTWFAKKFRETAQHLADVTKDVRYQRYALAPILPIGR